MTIITKPLNRLPVQPLLKQSRSPLQQLVSLALLTSSLIFAPNLQAAPTCTAIAGTTAGNATISASNEYILTQNVTNQLSALWGKNRVNLSQSFDYSAQVYLGDNDEGADGMTFTLQNKSSTALGQNGRGLGSADTWSGVGTTDKYGLSPSLVIELDTYYNNDAGWSDPTEDHLAVYANGNGRHSGGSTDLVSPIKLGNIEDNQYHEFRVVWTAPEKKLQVYFDGALKVTKTIDIATILGTTTPYWGYTASTGLISNTQKVCNQTDPSIPNLAPTITSNGGGDSAAISINENSKTVTTVTATDPDSDTIGFSIIGGTDADKFTISASTGALTFITAPDYENPTDSDKNNTYNVIVKASDPKGALDTQNLTITVKNLTEIPAVTCSGYYATVYDSNGTANNNDYYGWTQPYNNNPVGTFKYVVLENTSNWMSINTKSWYSAADITDGIGDDAGYVGTKLPAIEWDHAIEYKRIITAAEAGNYRFNLRYGDDHVKIYKNGTLIYSKSYAYSGGPFEVFPSYALAAGDELTIAVIEEDLFNTSLQLDITPLFANPCNKPPVITSDGGADTASVSITEGTSAVTIVTATDPENDTLTYSITGGADASKFKINSSSGVLEFVAAPTYGVLGDLTKLFGDANSDNIYDVTVQVSDPQGGTDTQTISVQVNQKLYNLKLQTKAKLQGPFSEKDQLMSDALRVKGFLPKTQPFTNLIGTSGLEIITDSLLTVTGNNAIVDWVLVELRDPNNSKKVVASIPSLIQRDGDIINPFNGTTELVANGIPLDKYYVSVRHRNHLGIMTQSPVMIEDNKVNVIDFNVINPSKKSKLLSVDGSLMLAGDINRDNKVIANGPGNDATQVLSTILLAPANTIMNSNFIISSYSKADLNLDGEVIFAGPNNDVNLLAFDIIFYPDNGNLAQNYIIAGRIPNP